MSRQWGLVCYRKTDSEIKMKWLVLSIVLLLSLSAVAGHPNPADQESNPTSGTPEQAETPTADTASDATSAPEEHAETNLASSEQQPLEQPEASAAGEEEPEVSAAEEESNQQPEAAQEQATQEQPHQNQFKRTVILIHKKTNFGENLFIRGGIDHDKREGCGWQENLDEDPCSIAIENRPLDVQGSVEARDAWAQGDNHLDWYGAEPGQGQYGDVKAEGTPAQWTTNDDSNEYYSSLNTSGPDYWLVDFNVDCSQTQDGFFEFKALLNNQWEPSNFLNQRCSGDHAKELPYQSANHFAQCGFINVYEWGQGQCQIESFN